MAGTIGDQLKAAGYTRREINRFDVCSLADNVIDFPEERLGLKRTRHESRLVIVLQNDKDNHDPTIKVCAIAPLSTSRQYHYRLDFPLKKSECQFLPEDSFIRLSHVQPVLKTDIKAT